VLCVVRTEGTRCYTKLWDLGFTRFSFWGFARFDFFEVVAKSCKRGKMRPGWPEEWALRRKEVHRTCTCLGLWGPRCLSRSEMDRESM
jgi:hypothetical protein